MEGLMKNSWRLLFVSVLAVMALVVKANISENDSVWQERASQAKAKADKAYHSNPDQVMEDFNSKVKEAGVNMRRSLKEKSDGSCEATNPIDKCWRCQKDWAENRQKLADCAMGFGSHATGGKGGEIYVVTDPSDNDMVNPKPGTLRHAVIQKEPLWITFQKNMNIRLNQELLITNDKTIDGRGAKVVIASGSGLVMQFVHNVIIHNLVIHDIKPGSGGTIRDSVDHYGIRGQSDGDAISIFGSTNIWIDHITLSNCQDGLVDIIEGSTAVTVSNCLMTKHNDVMLLGASDKEKRGDDKMQVTVAFNHFGEGLIQRMPRARWGLVHVVNNDYTHWIMYAIGGSSNPTILSQGNRFMAPNNAAAKEVTKRDYASESEWKNWLWKSEGDVMLNGAFFVESGNKNKKIAMSDSFKPEPGTAVEQLTRFAGALACTEGQPC